MEFIGTTSGDDVDHSAAGASNFGRESTGIHLKFLDGVLAERIRAKTGAACCLTKKKIVRVRTVDEQRIVRTPLSTKGEITAAGRILNHTWSQNGEIDEVPAIHR